MRKLIILIALLILYITTGCKSNYRYVKSIGEFKTNKYTLINHLMYNPDNAQEIIRHYGYLSKDFKDWEKNRGCYDYIEVNIKKHFNCCYVIYHDRVYTSIIGRYQYLSIVNNEKNEVMIVTFVKRFFITNWKLHNIEFQYFSGD